MSLRDEAKTFIRGMVEALDDGLDRILRKEPAEQLFLASQLIGSCDSLTAILLFFGKSVPAMRRFSEGARVKLAEIRKAARVIRSNAYLEVCEQELPAVEPEADPAVDADGAEVTDIGGANA